VSTVVIAAKATTDSIIFIIIFLIWLTRGFINHAAIRQLNNYIIYR